MRTLIALIICLSFTLTSCNKVYHNTFIVENKTNKKIRIEGFATVYSKEINRSSVYFEVFDIQPDSQYLFLKDIGESQQPQGVFEAPHIIDSVNIIFNNERIIKYTCFEPGHFCFDKKNILNYEEYFEKYCGEHECIYTYTITEQEYDSATVISR